MAVVRGLDVSILPPYGPLPMPHFAAIGVDRNFYARACDTELYAVDEADVTSVTEQQYFFFGIP